MEQELVMHIKVNSITIGETADPIIDIRYPPQNDKLQLLMDIVFNKQYLKSLLDS